MPGAGCDSERDATAPDNVADHTVELTNSIVVQLERQLDLARVTGVQRDEETATARMYAASQALRLKKSRAELAETVRECAKETRERKKAEKCNERLLARLDVLEQQLERRHTEAETSGLTLEASQALIAQLHEAHQRRKDCEVRLEKVENELRDARQGSTESTLGLAREIEGLQRELERVRSHSKSLDGPSAVDVGLQVATNDIFDLWETRCDHLLRDKISAEAYSIQTKAEMVGVCTLSRFLSLSPRTHAYIHTDKLSLNLHAHTHTHTLSHILIHLWVPALSRRSLIVPMPIGTSGTRNQGYS